MNADQLGSLQLALSALLEKFRTYFKGEPTFKHRQSYLAGFRADLKRRSVEPIAVAVDVPARSLQEFPSQFV